MSRFLRRFRKDSQEKTEAAVKEAVPAAEPEPPPQPPPVQEPVGDLAPAEEEPKQQIDEYDPQAYAHLEVNEDVRQLFDLITNYNAQPIELETLFTPFIPEYIPAVGDVDAFIKIPRPDDIEDELGLSVLDEPSVRQTDTAVLGLQLRANTKEALPKGTVVKRVARADKNEREVENWIRSISELHRSKPATNVHYTKPMPDIDTLMQEWPADFEEVLKNAELPSADMDLTLEQYIDTICTILDIPVYKSRVQSLHVLFSLYSEFKNSQHFQVYDDEPGPIPEQPAERLEL